mmetsp:Transcript_126407/g.363575  ORF Transcript_126407/g.363575 Transcript_126407/m.363575 type:complete len:119 (+) Transcript_126407:880-1236(+)
MTDGPTSAALGPPRFQARKAGDACDVDRLMQGRICPSDLLQHRCHGNGLSGDQPWDGSEIGERSGGGPSNASDCMPSDFTFAPAEDSPPPGVPATQQELVLLVDIAFEASAERLVVQQ